MADQTTPAQAAPKPANTAAQGKTPAQTKGLEEEQLAKLMQQIMGQQAATPATAAAKAAAKPKPANTAAQGKTPAQTKGLEEEQLAKLMKQIMGQQAATPATAAAKAAAGTPKPAGTPKTVAAAPAKTTPKATEELPKAEKESSLNSQDPFGKQRESLSKVNKAAAKLSREVAALSALQAYGRNIMPRKLTGMETIGAALGWVGKNVKISPNTEIEYEFDGKKVKRTFMELYQPNAEGKIAFQALPIKEQEIILEATRNKQGRFGNINIFIGTTSLIFVGAGAIVAAVVGGPAAIAISVIGGAALGAFVAKKIYDYVKSRSANGTYDKASDILKGMQEELAKLEARKESLVANLEKANIQTEIVPEMEHHTQINEIPQHEIPSPSPSPIKRKDARTLDEIKSLNTKKAPAELNYEEEMLNAIERSYSKGENIEKLITKYAEKDYSQTNPEDSASTIGGHPETGTLYANPEEARERDERRRQMIEERSQRTLAQMRTGQITEDQINQPQYYSEASENLSVTNTEVQSSVQKVNQWLEVNPDIRPQPSNLSYMEMQIDTDKAQEKAQQQLQTAYNAAQERTQSTPTQITPAPAPAPAQQQSTAKQTKSFGEVAKTESSLSVGKIASNIHGFINQHQRPQQSSRISFVERNAKRSAGQSSNQMAAV